MSDRSNGPLLSFIVVAACCILVNVNVSQGVGALGGLLGELTVADPPATRILHMLNDVTTAPRKDHFLASPLQYDPSIIIADI